MFGVATAVDPYFGLPLWLQAGFRGHLLWAYNLRHLDLLEGYVAARLRERHELPLTTGSMTMITRLPVWIKAAKNRDEFLRTIGRMRASAPATA
jgi:hypothetical protein